MKLNFKIVKGDIEKQLKDQKRNERYVKMIITPKVANYQTNESSINIVTKT